MSDQWIPGAGPQQWGMPPASQSQSNQGWGEWQSLPPASITHQQFPVHQSGGFQSTQQYQHQQPVNQKTFIQEQVARAREEQKYRELELQKQRMRSMNVAQAKPLSSIDSLIGLEGMSPSTKKRASTQRKPPPTTITSTPQPSLNKPRAWTMDTSSFNGVFNVAQDNDEDSFGEFQVPPPPSYGVGGTGGGITGGVVLTSSYTRPISSVKSSSPVIGQRNRSTSSPHIPRIQPQPVNSSSSVDQSAFPPLYIEVYNACLVDGSLSTELLFPVLMSSNLPKNLLGELWQHANRKVPGQLTKTELFVLLGLIGLAQNGHPNPRFANLQKVPAPPVPVLNIVRKPPPPQSVTNSLSDDFGTFQQGPLINTPPLLTVVSSHSSNVTSSSVLSFGASSTFPPLVNTSSLDSTQKHKHYDPISTAAKLPAASNTEFGEFKTATASTDKFAAFDVLKATSEEPTISSDTVLGFGEFKSGSVQSVKTPEILTALNTPSTTPMGDFTVVQPSSNSSFSVAPDLLTTRKEQNSDFGSFASVSVPTSFANFGSSSSDTMGWADFTSATHILSTSSLDTGPTLQQSLTTAHVMPLSVGSVLSAVSLDTVELKAETKPTKPVTGLDILNAEMEARLLAKKDSYIPSVDKPLVPESLDDFGDFEMFGGSSQVKSVPSQECDIKFNKPPPDSCEVWKKCLNKCVEMLEVCVNVFGGVEEAGLREEIAQSEEGRNKLKGVVEVYRLARRVFASLRDKDRGVGSEDYTKAIQAHWSTLTSQLPGNVMDVLYSETTPTNEGVTAVNDVLSDTISKCSLCLTSKNVTISASNSLDNRPEDYPLTLLFHNGHTYHASCANFWINVVQDELPVLA